MPKKLKATEPTCDYWDLCPGLSSWLVDRPDRNTSKESHTMSMDNDAQRLCEPLSKLLVSPLITPIVVPHVIPHITPFKELRLWLM